ncbi:MAG: SDR family oxidoreductase [Ruminococcaceae bacterium]|nr:SDR family oxidoreductase [Oscillospiraceae bacterium]
MKILITGASQGIGLAIAQELYENGHELFLVGRDGGRLQEALCEFPERVSGETVDLSDPGQIRDFADRVLQKGFSPDVLILNAAAFGPAGHSVVQPSAEELQMLLQTNLLADYRLVQKFLPSLRLSAYPRVILIGSTASIRTDSGSLYSISKWALRSYAYSLRDELKTQGVGVTLLNPGGTFTQKRVPDDKTPPGRLLEASDIAKLVAVLLTLSPQAVVEELNVRPMLGDTY